MKLGLPFSISIIFWFLVGLIRFFSEEIFAKPKRIRQSLVEKKLKKVAVCVPAHNEEVVIARTIRSIKRLLPTEQIFVVSDGSQDRTATIARELGAKVSELLPGRGKSGALLALLEHFHILKRYEFVLFVDADTLLDRNYLKNAIALFESDKTIAAIAGYVVSGFKKQKRLSKQQFFEAYRVRLNRLIQLFLVYGQTWKFTNVTPVIPGSCSIYRTRVLKNLELHTPGILIEDFNLAFQIHKKRLGKIAHHPKIFSIDQDPDNFKDYWNQVRRWNVGFYQTVRKHGIWPSFFWAATALFTFEVLGYSVFLLSLPVIAAASTIAYYAPIMEAQFLPAPQVFPITPLQIWQVFVVVFLLDYAWALLVALHDKQYKLAVYGMGFFLFAFINSLILLSSIPLGFLRSSTGEWTPPRRR